MGKFLEALKKDDEIPNEGLFNLYAAEEIITDCITEQKFLTCKDIPQLLEKIPEKTRHRIEPILDKAINTLLTAGKIKLECRKNLFHLVSAK